MKRPARILVSVLAALPFLAAVSVAGAQKPAPKASAYAPVDKIIKAKCIGCHNGPSAADGIDLSSYAKVTKAKAHGKALVVAKKASESVISKAVHGKGAKKMPPNGSLSPAEVKTIDGWITAGAKP